MTLPGRVVVKRACSMGALPLGSMMLKIVGDFFFLFKLMRCVTVCVRNFPSSSLVLMLIFTHHGVTDNRPSIELVLSPKPFKSASFQVLHQPLYLLLGGIGPGPQLDLQQHAPPSILCSRALSSALIFPSGLAFSPILTGS